MLVLCQKLHIVHMTDKISPVTGPASGTLGLPLPQSGGAGTAPASFAPIKTLPPLKAGTSIPVDWLRDVSTTLSAWINDVIADQAAVA